MARENTFNQVREQHIKVRWNFLCFPEVLTHSPVLPNTQFDFIEKEFLTTISDYPLRRSKMWFQLNNPILVADSEGGRCRNHNFK